MCAFPSPKAGVQGISRSPAALGSRFRGNDVILLEHFKLRVEMIATKPELYRDLARQLAALIAGEPDPIANAANTAALIYHGLPNLNWAGFYFRNGAELVLGPFQGKPACVRILVGKGVCGTAVAQGATILVPDLHGFPGHIACDPISRSELVVPLIEDGSVFGVLDLDSPLPARFDELDREGCEQLVAVLLVHYRKYPPRQIVAQF
jgi:L-methionine (R)-S-oxide reductase